MSAPADLSNFKVWGRAEVIKFFKEYVFEEDEMKQIQDLWLRGDTLPTLNVGRLREWGIPLGLADRIIRTLQEVGIQSSK